MEIWCLSFNICVCHLIFVFFFLVSQMASNQEDTHETHDTNEAQNVESEIK